MIILLVAIGAAIGAPARYLTDRAVSTRWNTVFPFGTLTVNVIGSLILGLVLGSQGHKEIAALLGTGFCGALTTYSTFSYETIRLAHDRLHRAALLNIVVSLAAGCAAAWAGVEIARMLWG
jgi:CrcB protein